MSAPEDILNAATPEAGGCDAAPVLAVDDLRVSFSTPDGPVDAVRGVSLAVARGECLGVVGESGSGKSQTFLAALGLLAPNGRATGAVRLLGRDVLGRPQKALKAVLGRQVTMIFQDPLTSLTPHMRIADQMAETLRGAGLADAEAVARQSEEMLDLVRIPEAKRRLAQYPHELSGGMRQRVMIAMAFLPKPDLIIADEPTTALDVTVQAQVLDIMADLMAERGVSIALITHDMGVVARMCDRVAVMRGGEIVEQGDAEAIFYRPQTDYTKMLLAATPRLEDAGNGASAAAGPAPLPTDAAPVLDVRDLRVEFPIVVGGGVFPKKIPLRAVNGVSFRLRAGETLGVVGESGCGKSTLVRAILRLIPPTGGEAVWLGQPLSAAPRREMQRLRSDLQIVFQDPLASLDPRMTVGDSIAEPLWVHRPGLSKAEGRTEVAAIMERCGLAPELINRYPHELSGGQNQRVGIARAVILRPRLLICDEAVSALDTSVQRQILALLKGLQAEFGLSMIFISHDLAVVKEISHRVMVLYLGRIVELAGRDVLYSNAKHPYTKALLAAAPTPDPKRERAKPRRPAMGEPPSPLDPKAALRFLPSKLPPDAEGPFYEPLLIEQSPGHFVAEFDAHTDMTMAPSQQGSVASPSGPSAQ